MFLILFWILFIYFAYYWYQGLWCSIRSWWNPPPKCIQKVIVCSIIIYHPLKWHKSSSWHQDSLNSWFHTKPVLNCNINQSSSFVWLFLVIVSADDIPHQVSMGFTQWIHSTTEPFMQYWFLNREVQKGSCYPFKECQICLAVSALQTSGNKHLEAKKHSVLSCI